MGGLKRLLVKREYNPRARTAYHQRGPVFREREETYGILPCEDEERAKVVDEMLRKYDWNVRGAEDGIPT